MMSSAHSATASLAVLPTPRGNYKIVVNFEFEFTLWNLPELNVGSQDVVLMQA